MNTKVTNIMAIKRILRAQTGIWTLRISFDGYSTGEAAS